MKLATIALLAAALPMAAAAQTPASVTITSTHYCSNGSCHAREYDLLQRVAQAAAHQQNVESLHIQGTLANDAVTRTITIDGDLPHGGPPMHGGPPEGGPPQGGGGPPDGGSPQGAPPQLKLHASATYRGMQLLRASGEVRDASGHVVERWTIST